MMTAASKVSVTSVVTHTPSTPGKGSNDGGGVSHITIRASLPSARSASTSAMPEPMASPSGRSCDDTTIRVAAWSRATIAASSGASVRGLGVIGRGR